MLMTKKSNGQVIVCKGVPSYSGIVTIHRWSFQSCLPVILLTKRGVFICGHYPQCIGLHHTGNSPPLAQTLASRYEKSLYRDPPSQGLAPASPPLAPSLGTSLCENQPGPIPRGDIWWPLKHICRTAGSMHPIWILSCFEKISVSSFRGNLMIFRALKMY